jgi:two-component system, chemotaxis family, CheB/CheR fusion protein
MTSEQIDPAIAQTPSGAADEPSAPVDYSPRARLSFPVVGVGASAGGIDALRTFFGASSPDSGMAYVVIQHLSPEHDSMMAEILSRSTTMPVLQIEAGMRVEPNHVYVIRPGYTVTLRGGELHLGEPVEKRGHRRPIDDFFRSLAEEQKEKALAVILTGTGTNGSAGAQAIKAAGGLCIAQDPESAEFPGMPQSVIHAGYADQVLRLEEIPEVLRQYSQHPFLGLHAKGRTRAAQELERHRQQLHEIVTIVRAGTGHDFAPYKPPTVLRRIDRRMGLLGIQGLPDYARHLRERPEEVTALANDLMINVTGFFRDPEAWEAFRESVARPLVEGSEPNATLRAWVTACASGEEAYSLAMLIAEETSRVGKSLQVKIFATDTADKSLALARAGIFPGGIEGNLSAERLEKFFDREEHTFRIKKTLRDQVVFAPHDVLRDPPFSRVDIVTCRNLLIYLEPEAQRRALTLMHFALREGGYLFLGNAESLGHAQTLFETVSKRWRIYRRSGTRHSGFAQLPALGSHSLAVRNIVQFAPTPLARPSPSALIQAALLDEYGPPCAIVDRNERLVYFHGDAQPYLHLPPGEITHNLLDLVRVALRPAVRSALRVAIADRRPLRVEAALDSAERVIVDAAPLRQGQEPEYFRVSFLRPPDDAASAATHSPVSRSGVEAANSSSAQVAALEHELQLARRELQSNLESFEATHEELKASNEEVTSINEELQSTNEELETGKEELHALNEELSTVNAQLQTKLIELEFLTNDLDNLLSSTDIAVVFLDTELCVRRFTSAVTDLLQLIPGDIGRPLAHLAQKFTDGDMLGDAAQVLATLVRRESEALSNSGRWYLRRTLPYRTEDNRIAGVVITFVDITARKQAEQAIANAQARLQSVLEQMPAAVLMAEAPSGKLLLANRQAAALFNQPFPLPFMGHHWTAVDASFRAVHADGRPFSSDEWPLARVLATGETVVDEELDFLRVDGERSTLAMSASPIHDARGDVVAAVAAFWDVTERRRAQQSVRESEARFRMLVESAHDFAIFMLDFDGRVVSWNQGAERVTGYAEEEILGQFFSMLFTPEDRAADIPRDEMRRSTECGQITDERWHLRKDGSRFWASGVLTLARDPSTGAPQGFVNIMRDQTQRKESDAQLQEALHSAQQLRARAEGANRAKDEFISTVSHELRTPLNTIRLWSRMFMSGKVQEKEVIAGGRAIDRAALAQQQLVDDLLDVSRMATGQLRLAQRDTLLLDAVNNAVEAIRPLADNRHIELSSELSPDVGIVHVDPERIQQVVWNLLANAVKFTPDGGRVSVYFRRIDATVEIEVRDTGIGIRADVLPHIFERFRQGEAGASRRFGGLGLGLAIAKQLVELQGGRITPRSEGEGRGASFIISLPLERRGGQAAEDSDARQNSSRLSGIEVLLVEDETLAREATELILDQHGAQVRSVNSAAGAREALALRRPLVLVADIGMPTEDGYSLLRALRAAEREQNLSRLPAVAVTAFARSEDRERALAAGFDEHLPKPVDPERLVELVARLVDHSGNR